MNPSQPPPAPGIPRRGFLKIIAAAGLAAGLSVAGARRWLELQAAPVVHATRLLMGTIVNLTVAAPQPEQAQLAATTVFAEMERWVRILNHRDPASALSRLNIAGVLDACPAELLEVVSKALEIGALTGGAFDVTVKPVLDAYAVAPPERTAEISALRPLVDYRQVTVAGRSIRLGRPGMQLTLDGLAKGRVVDAGLEALRRLGFENILIEAGGDLAALGCRADGRAWEIGVESPRAERGAQPVAILPVGLSGAPAAVATSGDYLHSFTADFSRHHIIDPRSLGPRGECTSPYECTSPCEFASPGELASATAIASTAMEADALSTALLVLGARPGLALVESLPNVEALLVGKDMIVYKSSGIE